ncbi:hypothetical protein Bcav_3836 [Beutenbergia cavernae DSM 12333]|uniref:Uncharacterized protein n=1 Tax=Beutenbergia cavernae (strain ATCC BAA-8 / DSM 12333 / CCUG 43141 / JCM 11478 / NBRC 16432 / NCIMB 13614 / HKI 0122) TaxID=471853 RepID=C5C4F4_BEUC1|nr:hypothetical protein [Beutenbergia cavernae]ACQ82078.1 hypothetical protein Bcav_3836 [Beutenbergia cavernae DSM 12333]
MVDVQQQVRELAGRTKQSLLEARQRAIDEVEITSPGDVLGVAVLAEVLEEFDTTVDEFYTWLDDKIDYLGMPDELQLTASSWIENVAGTMTGLAQNVETGDLLVDDNWTGEAADRYKQRVPDQVDALAAIRGEYALPLASALNGVKDGVIAFVAGLVVALLALGIALLTATTLVGALGALLVAAGAVYFAVVMLQGGLESADATLRGILTSLLQRWPAFAH